MSRQNQKEKLNLAVFDYLKTNYPETAKTFSDEANLASTLAGASSGSSSVASRYISSSPIYSRYSSRLSGGREGGDGGIEEGMLEKRWASTTKMQMKIIELEKQISQLNEKLSLYQNVSKHASDFDGIPQSPPIGVLAGHRKAITKALFHPVFQIIVTASDDTTIKVWNYENEGRLEKSLNAHTDAVTDIAFDLSGKWLISASADTTIKLWDFLQYECKRTLHGHDALVSSVLFTPNQSSILSCSKDKTVKLWEISTGFCLRTYTENDEWVRCVACHFSPTVKLFAFCGNDKKIHLWHSEDGHSLQELSEHTHVVEYVSFGTYELLNHLLENGKAPPPIPLHLREVSKGMLNMKNGELRSSSSFVSSASKNFSSSSSFTLSPSSSSSSASGADILNKAGVVIISASRDRTIKLWNAFNATVIQNYVGHENWVRHVVVHPQGKHLISCSDDKSIRIWNVLNGRCVKAITNAHPQFVTCLHFNSHSALLASGSLDCKVNIWACRKELPQKKTEKG